MKKTIDIDEKSGTITVTIELASRGSATDPIVNFMTGDVRLLLESDGIKFGACRKKDSLSNHLESDNRKGVWVFSTVPEKRPKIAKRQQATSSKKESLTKSSSSANIGSRRNNSSNQQRKEQ